MYQLWSEVFVFVIYLFLAFFLSFFNRMNRMLIGKVSQLVIQFVVYVVQPLFYLHGEASFRNNCINQGISHALKKVLFDHYTLFHINNTIAPRQNMSWNETVLAEYPETLYYDSYIDLEIKHAIAKRNMSLVVKFVFNYLFSKYSILSIIRTVRLSTLLHTYLNVRYI